ncbi:hypothetical protein DTO271G3_4950 [Paecilomyces variotii]|nr:hypothetical protein DTO271G3_4950 [Paecilomyces variotii]
MRRSEILVHVSAPSRAKDDARYRTLAEAAAAFEPLSRQCVFSDQEINCNRPGSEDGSARSARASPTSQEGGINSGDELESVISTQESISINKSRSVTKRPAPGSEELPSGSPDNEESNTHHPDRPSGLQDSRDSTASKEDGVRDQPSQGSCMSGSLETPLSVIPESQPAPPPTEAGDTALENLQLPDVHVERSFHSEFSDTRKRRRLNAESSADSSTTTDMRVPSSLPEGRQLQDTNQQIQPEKGAPSASSNASAVDSLTAGPSPQNKTSHDPGQSLSLDVLPLMLRPPPPPVSTERFETHITPTLRMLAERLKRSRTYQPLRQTREPDKLERGFWYLRIYIADQKEGSGENQKEKQNNLDEPKANQWTISFFTRFWSFLTDFIAKEGRAGWGVWCILEKASVPKQDSTCRQLTLKVYTWGEVTSHVYLLLFLASERRIRGMGAQWKDGAENTVIEMP